MTILQGLDEEEMFSDLQLAGASIPAKDEEDFINVSTIAFLWFVLFYAIRAIHALNFVSPFFLFHLKT